MDSDSITLTREDLQILHTHYREMKHSINNTFAVIMALSELGQRNPGHLEKLAKSVLDRSPDVVRQLAEFGDMLGAKLKAPDAPITQSPTMSMSGIFQMGE